MSTHILCCRIFWSWLRDLAQLTLEDSPRGGVSFSVSVEISDTNTIDLSLDISGIEMQPPNSTLHSVKVGRICSHTCTLYTSTCS